MFQLNRKASAFIKRGHQRYVSRDEDLALQAPHASNNRSLQPVNWAIVHDLGWILAFLDIPLVLIRNAISPMATSDFLAIGISGCAAALVSMSLRFGLSARWGAILLVSNTFMLLAYFAVIKGGLAAPILAISPIVPVFAALVLGLRAGWLATAAIAIGLVILSTFPPSTTALTGAAEHTASWGVARGLMLFSCCVLVMLAAWGYERRHRTMVRVLRQSAFEDSLTGVANRRALDARLEKEFTEWGQYKTLSKGESHKQTEKLAVSIIIFDIDNFKTLNDKLGHQAGDAALVTVADISRQITTRKADFIGRYGGDEFIVILPGASADDAMLVAKRIQAAIRSARIEMPIGPSANDANWHTGSLTLSIGVATALDCSDADSDPSQYLLARADAALYEAKRNGRNQIAAAENMAANNLDETSSFNHSGNEEPEVMMEIKQS